MSSQPPGQDHADGESGHRRLNYGAVLRTPSESLRSCRAVQQHANCVKRRKHAMDRQA